MLTYLLTAAPAINGISKARAQLSQTKAAGNIIQIKRLLLKIENVEDTDTRQLFY